MPPPPSPPLHGYALLTLAAPGRTFAQAEALCDARGGTLAQVASAEANAAVVSALSADQIAWIGGQEMSEGEWRWTNGGGTFPPTSGATFAYHNWASGEDASASGLQCVALDSADGKWYALDCSERSQALVCQEIAPPPSPPLIEAPSAPPSPPSPPDTEGLTAEVEALKASLAALSATVGAQSTTIGEHSTSIGEHAAALSCESRRRMDSEQDPAATLSTSAPSPDRDAPTERDLLSDYLDRNPDLAAKMDVGEMLRHFYGIEQHFGQPARA